jgi:hypothetical protein
VTHRGVFFIFAISAEKVWKEREYLLYLQSRNEYLIKPVETLLPERFFRNLLLGEKWDLRNRYLHINPSKEWSKQPNFATRTSNKQVPEQVPEQVEGLLYIDNPLIIGLIKEIGDKELSIAEIMKILGLKHRPNFLKYHLNPAIMEGFVSMKYPGSPRHPRQKYLLTGKGLALYKELGE